MGININDVNFKQEVLEEKLPVLVDFWAEWCGPCRMIAPVIEQISKEYEGKLKVCKLNVDDAAGIASNYNIMGIPTLVIFKSGQVVDKLMGALPKQDIEATLKKHI